MKAYRIVKHMKPKVSDICDPPDEWYSFSHARARDVEFTMCSVAWEQWDDKSGGTPKKKVTCPECICEIKHAKSFKDSELMEKVNP